MEKLRNINFLAYSLFITGVLVEDRYLKASLLAAAMSLFLLDITQEEEHE